MDYPSLRTFALPLALAAAAAAHGAEQFKVARAAGLPEADLQAPHWAALQGISETRARALGLGDGSSAFAFTKPAGSAAFTIAFDPDARPVRYELQVQGTGPSARPDQVEIRDDTGRALTATAIGASLPVTGGPGKVLTVIARLPATFSAADREALSVRLIRAPILESQATFFPRVAGGLEVQPGQFKEVGALLQDGRPHCTATLIGEDTLLTAAHCVFLREPGMLSFAEGTNAWKPISTIPVASYRYPNNELGFTYEDKSLRDDIAVVKLAHKVSTGTVPLHAGLPELTDVMKESRPLTFVGYGYRLVNDSPADPGFKRFVAIPIGQLGTETFRNTLPGVNTCNGDSGGPALFTHDEAGTTRWVVAGVTSGGDLACTGFGVNTRVDRYREWILQMKTALQ